MEVSSNGEKSYVANQLSVDLAWNDVMMDIAGSYPNHQQVKMPKYKVSDKLELLHRSGKRTYTFNTYNAYMVNPHSLTVDNSQQTAYQSVRSAAFFSHTNTSLGFFLKPFTVMMKVGLQVFNLFNQRTYGYTVYSGLTRTGKEYKLRGRTILMSMFFHF